MTSRERYERDLLILELYQGGMTQGEVAHEMMMSRPRINMILQELKEPARKVGRPRRSP